MQAIKRELLLCLTISALVFTGALVWGYPFTTFSAGAQATAVRSNAAQQTAPNDAQPQSQAGQQQQQQTGSTFTGTIVKSGSSYALRTSSGTYMLSGATNAANYVGQTVTVTGQLDELSKTIDVSNIQPA